MKNIFLFLSSVLFLTACNTGSTYVSDEKAMVIDDNSYHLVWQDEFDYSGLPDAEKWEYDTEGNEAGWGNNESQHYTEANDNNVQVENGFLHITAQKEDIAGKEYSSARLVSKADWEYGKIEVNAKLPSARGTWSAIWAMPGGWSFNDGNWPDVGEIDIMEHVGHDLGIVHFSAHSKAYQWQKGTQKTATIKVPDVHQEFHSYILEWTPKQLKGFVDDSLYFEYQNEGMGVDKWPYDKPFYLILNIAVGGAWGGEHGIDNNAFPQTMEIDYVRVYQKDMHVKKQ